jgi:hypothetical protein
MWAFHAYVHHEHGGLDSGAFTRFESHRTDGQAGRSTPFPYFDVWFFFKLERAVPGV